MSLASTSAFYSQMATLLRAGFTMAQALSHASEAASGWQATRAPTWADGCGNGRSWQEQLQEAGEDPLSVALVRAGESSGRLPEMCDRIAAIAEHLKHLRGIVIGRLVYPFFLANVALAAPGLPKAFLEGTWGAMFIGPAILWTVIIAIVVTIALSSRSGLGARLALLPGARFLTMPWVTANICQVLEAGVAAGMLFHDALDLAAPACGNRVIAERLRKAGGDLRHGRIERLTVALRQVALPTVVVQLIDGGEVSGKLEDSLMRAASFQRETFESRSLWSAKVLAGICFMAALLTAAYTIISMYAAYLNTALQMLDDT